MSSRSLRILSIFGEGQRRKLYGVLGLATDDMIHGGDKYHQSKIQIKKRYKLRKFQLDQGRFCGKDFTTMEDKSILINQPNFVKEKVQDIPIDKKRKKSRVLIL